MARFVLQNRRHFLGSTATGAAGLALLPRRAKANTEQPEPHYFLHLFFPGGMDATYTFDARPLAMTAEKQQQNYLATEPTIFEAAGGARSLRTNIVDPIMPHMDRFSVLNGVVMAPDFDGHEDNQSVLLTGNPLGGTSFHGLLGKALRTPVSAIISGTMMVSDSRVETAGAVRLSAKTAKDLSGRLSGSLRLEQDARLMNFFRQRFAVGRSEQGSFAKTKLLMGQTLGELPSLARSVSSMEVPEVTGETETVMDGVKLAAAAFKSGFCRSALCVFNTDLSENQNLDAHDFEGGKAQPRIIGELMTELAQILDYLRNTPATETKSLLDVTTVFITSEFGRTMRQYKFEESGTDHNALTNTMLIVGKGIVGGKLFGASDFASVEEFKAGPSKAHLTLDPSKYKIMGRPFDFTTFAPSDAKPEEFKIDHYLSAGNIVNTIMHLFNVPKSEWRTPTRNGDPSPILSALLA